MCSSCKNTYLFIYRSSVDIVLPDLFPLLVNYFVGYKFKTETFKQKHSLSIADFDLF